MQIVPLNRMVKTVETLRQDDGGFFYARKEYIGVDASGLAYISSKGTLGGDLEIFAKGGINFAYVKKTQLNKLKLTIYYFAEYRSFIFDRVILDNIVGRDPWVPVAEYTEYLLPPGPFSIPIPGEKPIENDIPLKIKTTREEIDVEGVNIFGDEKEISAGLWPGKRRKFSKAPLPST